MGRLQLNLFGKPEVWLDGTQVTAFESAKSPALLTFLAVTGQPHSRDTLATLLWGDLPETTAKRNLTKALTNLRQLLEPHLLIERHSVAFNAQLPADVDVLIFQAAVERSLLVEPDNAPQELTPLRRAVDLYRGDFLAGFFVKNALEFEEWALGQREYLRGLMLQALRHLTEQSARPEDNPATALKYCRRWLALDPWQEAAHRQMMQLLARSGQRDAALAQYETCRRILAEELGAEPMAETTALYERLKASGVPPRHNLPPPPNAFVGRTAELRQLTHHLTDPACRLLTLVGAGGIGKTRLAMEVARRCLESETTLGDVNFKDGVYFINLAPVSSAEAVTDPSPGTSQVTNAILATVAAALDFSWQGAAGLMAQLSEYLRDKHLLLVLDNFEHLVEAAELLAGWLHTSPGLKLMVTSRERLNLQEEWVHEIGGLDYPGREDPPLPVADLQGYEAVALFCLRAQQVRSDFSLSEERAPHVVRICQSVEGMPLALELAASWLRVLTCAEVAAEIERSLDFLTSSRRDIAPRHRSIRAVFEQSWHLLSAPEQTAFGKLSVFRGGFQREAARTVAGAGLPILTGLVDKSLLRLADPGRYHMHELLRQFAAEKLLAGATSAEPSGPRQPDSLLAVWQRYSTYYLNLAAQREAGLRGSTPQPALTELWAEIDNIRQAWQWAIIAAQIEEIEGALGGLARFYDLTSLFQEGAEVFGQAAQNLQARRTRGAGGAEPSLLRLMVKLWVEQARLLNRRGLSEQALQVIPQAAELARQIQDLALAALAYHQWGETLSFQGSPALAQARLEEALRLARAAGLGAIEAEALRHLGISRIDQGDSAGALTFYQESLACFRGLDDRRGEGMVLNNIAYLERGQGQLVEAETHYEQAHHIFQEIAYCWGQDAVLNNLANLRYDLGQYSQAQALCQQGLKICAEINDYWGEAHLLNTLGTIMREQGDFASAQSHYEQALSLWRKIGARLYEGVTLAELALLWHLLGRNEPARDCAQQAEQIGLRVGSPKIRASALTHLGHAQVALNLLPEAAESYGQALILCQTTGQFHFAREVLAGLIRVALAQNDLARAQAYAADLLPHLEIEKLYGAREPFRVYLTCYEVLRAGHDVQADTVLATAQRLLQTRAEEIPDEQLRRFYLENIPAHREIMHEVSRRVVQPI